MAKYRRGYRTTLKRKRYNPLVLLLLLIGCILFIFVIVMILSTSSDDYNNKSSESLLLLTDGSHDKEPVVTVAYVISLIKCGDMHSTSEGMSDAALVLRHSVHLQSIRNNGISKYDYKMYAIVHTQAVRCSQTLVDSGFEILIRDVPVNKSDIQDEYLRTHIHRALCCGHDEFIKLYAYTMLEFPIVVHVDVDFTFHKPMDDLYDAMLYDKDSPEGKLARSRLLLERPNQPLPDRIDCYMTRDWPQIMPGRKPFYQAGFLVIRPDLKAFDTIINVIKTTKYVMGFGRDNGWGGKGYGSLVGDMAMQGLMAYVYDEVLKDNWVELNQCRFNHMGLDTLYRNEPSFRPNHPKAGTCRNDLDYCEDCQHTNVSDIYNIHYTLCRKPWNCVGERSSEYPDYKWKAIPEQSVNYDHCMKLLYEWHSIRIDLENQLYQLTGDDTIKDGQVGTYKSEVFRGHCNQNSGDGYIQMSAKTETLKRIPELYQ